MTKRKQGPIRSRAEYALLLSCYAALAWTPLWLARGFAHAAADVWRMLDGKHRRLAIEQSMDRLGIDSKRAARLVRDNYRHYALLVLEIARLRRMPVEEVARRTKLNGLDTILSDVLSHGKGVIIVTGHLGNWEWGAVSLGMLDLVDGVIARELDNPLIDNFMRDIRQRTGAAVWDKFGSMRKAIAAVKKGRGFVAVMDQDGGRKGLRVPFLGKEGSTMSAPVELSIRTGAPIFVGAMMRNGAPVSFNMVPKRVHWPEPGADFETEKLRLATAVNEDLSEIIREHPEQWIWIHRRWKVRT